MLAGNGEQTWGFDRQSKENLRAAERTARRSKGLAAVDGRFWNKVLNVWLATDAVGVATSILILARAMADRNIEADRLGQGMNRSCSVSLYQARGNGLKKRAGRIISHRRLTIWRDGKVKKE